MFFKVRSQRLGRKKPNGIISNYQASAQQKKQATEREDLSNIQHSTG